MHDELLLSGVLSRIFFVDTTTTAKRFGGADAHLKLRYKTIHKRIFVVQFIILINYLSLPSNCRSSLLRPRLSNLRILRHLMRGEAAEEPSEGRTDSREMPHFALSQNSAHVHGNEMDEQASARAPHMYYVTKYVVQ